MKIDRPKNFFDDELKAKGKRRIYRSEAVMASDGRIAFVYRENLIKEAEYTDNKTPWWKNTKKGKK